MYSFSVPSVRPRFVRPISPIWLVFSVSVALLAVTPDAPAQITVESLIGNAVSDDLSRYKNVEEAIKRFGNRDVLAARQFLERERELNPNLPPTDLTLAKMYILTRQLAAGRVSLERTVRDHPGDPEPYLILGDELLNQRRYAEAEALYDKTIRLIPEFSGNEKRKRNFVIRAHAGRAAVFTARQDWQKALEDLRIWIEQDPDNANAHRRIGQALFLSEKYQEGFEHLQKARELDDSLANPYVTAALLYGQLGQAEQAQATFQRAVESGRNDANTLLAYAQWLIQSGDISEAEKTLAAARRVDKESLEVLTLSGVAAKMNQKMKPAEDYYVQALRLAPSNHGVINQLALLLINQPDDQKRKRALEFARVNAQLYPDNPESNITLSWVLYSLGAKSEARQALQKGVQLGNLNADTRYLIAKMLADQDQNETAVQLLKEALQSTQGIFVHRAEAQALLDSLQ